MGAETQLLFIHDGIMGGYKVKLNNPLMGAETIPTIRLGLTCLKLLVKLNNPLMGAETL